MTGPGDASPSPGSVLDRDTGDAFVVVDGFDAPPALWKSTRGVPHAVATPPSTASRRAAMSVRQVEYPSLDGTTIGMFLIHRDDVTPTTETQAILNGYGGFAIAETPVWSPKIAAWCAAGGLYAIAGLRGGIEEGEAWHHAGRRDNKQNVFDDFHAAADWLVAGSDVTRAAGRSRPLQRGPAHRRRHDATTRPLPRRVVRRAAARHDPLPAVPDRQAVDRRVRRSRRGRGVRLAPRLLAVPPRARRAALPGALFSTAEGDTRVDPMHARKMAALLQAASPARTSGRS